MKYIDLINLGFKREEFEDEVFFEHFGYKSFALTFKLSRRHYMEWNPDKPGKVNIYKLKTDLFYIEKSFVTKHIDDVKMLVNMFGWWK